MVRILRWALDHHNKDLLPKRNTLRMWKAKQVIPQKGLKLSSQPKQITVLNNSSHIAQPTAEQKVIAFLTNHLKLI